MYYEEKTGTYGFAAGLMIGAVLGAGLALLAAPQPGHRTRRRLARALTDAREHAGDRWVDLGDDVRAMVHSGRRRIRL